MPLVLDCLSALKTLAELIGRQRERKQTTNARLGELLIKISDCIDAIVVSAVENQELNNKRFGELLGYYDHASDVLEKTLEPSMATRVVSLYSLSTCWDSGYLFGYQNPALAALLLERGGWSAPMANTLATREERLAALAPVASASGELRAIGNILMASS
jgi:hypothetical protein